MIDAVETIEGVLQENASLTGNIVDGGSISGNLDSVGNIMAEKDVNFYDYDGSLLYSYTADEFLNMYSFPPNPKHRNFISEGWNWSLENAREYVLNYGKLDLGQQYNVEGDGAIIGLTITAPGRPWISLYLPIKDYDPNIDYDVTKDKHLIIDWGDGSEPEIWWGRSGPYETDVNVGHTYRKGEYEVKITSMNGAVFCVEPTRYEAEQYIKYAYLGKNQESIVIPYSSQGGDGPRFFTECPNLEYLTTLHEYENLSCCYKLKTIIVPRGVTHFDRYFNYCYNLSNTILSDTLEYINVGGGSNSNNEFKNIFIPMNWKQLQIIAADGIINNIIIPDGKVTTANWQEYIRVNLQNVIVENLRLPSVLSSTFGSNAYNGFMFNTSVVSSGIKLPSNINNSNISNFQIINSFIGDYLYIPPGITNFGTSDYTMPQIKICNEYITEDIKVEGLETVDCRNHTQIPTLEAPYGYLNDDWLAYVVVPTELKNQWKNATNWSERYWLIISAEDYDNM